MMATASVFAVQAQTVTNYSLDYTAGTFTPLSGATVLGSGASDDYNNKMYDGTSSSPSQTASGAGIDLGFTFTLGNDTFTHFIVNGNGYLILRNEGDDDYDAGYTASSAYYNAKNMVSGYAVSAGASDSTSVSYKIEGEEGNHVLTVQFLNVNGYGYSVYGDPVCTFSEQIKLFENGNKVQIIFGNCALNPQSSYGTTQFYVGLYKDGASTDLICKGDDGWENNSTSNYYTSIGIGSYNDPPTSGTTYTFTPPVPCEKPQGQPSDLTLDATSTSISGSFTTTQADQYLVLLSKGTLNSDAVPADGVTYSEGDSLGNAAVVQLSADPTFNISNGVDGATNYNVTVFAANTKCAGGPDYNLDNALTKDITTKPAAPESLGIVSADSTQIDLSALPVEGGDVLVAYADKLGSDFYGSPTVNGAFGEPSGDLKAGDAIDGGGTVVYVGGATNDIKVADLKPGHLYHFKAWTKQNGEYSSTAMTTSAYTASQTPWTADFSSTPTEAAPLGWNVGSGLSDRGWVLSKDNSYGSTDTTPYLENYGFKGEGGAETWVETPDIYLSDNANRLIFELRLIKNSGYYSTDTYTWNDNDSVTIQATTDGKTYTTLAQYGKNELPTFTDQTSYKKLYTTFYELAGKKVRLRINLKLNSNANIRLRNFTVEEKGQCDYPINVVIPDSTIIGDEVKVNWTPQGDENAWEVQYKKSSTDSWQGATKITTQERPLSISGLEGSTLYDVRVRALCSETEHSAWSDAAQFKSGLSVPFNITFANETSDPGWKSMTGELDTPSELTEGGHWAWANDWYGTSVSYSGSYSNDSASDWYISPKFDLGDGTWNSTASVKFNYDSYGMNADDYTVYLVVAADGEHFNAADTILALHKGELVSDSLYQVPLKGYKGAVRLGVLLKYNGGLIRDLKIVSIGVTPNCISDANSLEVTDTTTTTATIRWEGTADQWLVVNRKKGSADRKFVTVTGNEYTVENLEPDTEYEFGVTVCNEAGDTAKVVYVTYRTKAETPTAIDVINAARSLDGRVYTIDGRLVADKFEPSTLKPGVYIVNRKKVLIRK